MTKSGVLNGVVLAIGVALFVDGRFWGLCCESAKVLTLEFSH